MMKKLISIAMIMLFSGVVHAGGAMGPLKSFYARKLTATTTGTSIHDLLSAADQVTLDGSCNVTIFNPSATQLNVGGADVDSSTKFAPVCNTASCGTDRLAIDASHKIVFVMTTSGTLAFYAFFGGGC